MDPSRFQIITPATHEDFRQIVAPLAEACWPEFMLHDPVADANWGALFERFSGYQFGIFDNQAKCVAAMGNSLPLQWIGDWNNLPEEGWDWVFEEAVRSHQQGKEPNIQCAIQIAIHPDYQGQGLSKTMVRAMRSIGKSRGFKSLIAPVRPSQKSQYPLTAMDHYIAWKTNEGQPFDAWLRVHGEFGAKIVKVCHRSMVICGTGRDWESWTGLRFPESGRYVIPGALNPIKIDLKKGEGLYVEPNVWVVHNLNA
jgi:GNAT superfamily N-acetyltransferase